MYSPNVNQSDYECQAGCRMSAEPSVLTGDQLPKLTWNPPDEAGLLQFLVEEKSFSEDRIRKAIDRIKASHGKSTQGKRIAFIVWHDFLKHSCTAEMDGTLLV